MNINDFPTEAKDKISLIKKFIPIYKKIKDDKIKMTNFIKKISDNLSESIEEIRVNYYLNNFNFNFIFFRHY